MRSITPIGGMRGSRARAEIGPACYRPASSRESNVRTSSIVGWASTPPTARVESAPQAFAIARERSSGSPASIEARYPASNASPAPVVSSASIVGAAARTSRSPWAARAPSAPSFATTTPARSASARTASSSSSMPAMREASVALGRKTSVWPSRSRRPPSHPSDGSQLGSTEVVAPPARTRPNSAAALSLFHALSWGASAQHPTTDTPQEPTR